MTSILTSMEITYPYKQKNYINAIACNGAYSIITQSTRITANSATLIDHVITNDLAHTFLPPIILNDMTDHYPLLCNIRRFKTTNARMNTILYYRDKKKFSPDSFCIELNNSLIEIVCNSNPLQFENFDSAFDNFVSCISQMIDKHEPLKRLSKKREQQKLVKKPWIIKGILTSIRKKTPSSGLCS